MNTKIPGVLAPPPRTEIDGKIENLNLKTLPELQELLQRQEKLLKNKAFISRLRDRGEKIQSLYDRIRREIAAKGQVDQASNLLANLNINDMEWNLNRKTNENQILDSDDDSDEEDPLKVIAQSTHQVKSVVVLPKPEPLITEADLKIDDSSLDGHAKYVSEKTGKRNGVKSSFKPYKTTISDVHEPSKEKLRPKGKHWEVTAATPPPIAHEPAKMLNLEQSLALQRQYTQHMKDVKSKHATEKLASQLSFKIGDSPKFLLDYRDYSDSESEASETRKAEHHSDEEIFDDEDTDKGGVVFTVMK